MELKKVVPALLLNYHVSSSSLGIPPGAGDFEV